jgi:hypothetical protein
MLKNKPAVLIVSTDLWPGTTRLALRLCKYGARVSALCPAQSDLRFTNQIASCHSLRILDPWRSVRDAIEKSRAEYLVPGDELAYFLVNEFAIRFPSYAGLVERSMGPASSYESMRCRVRPLILAAMLGIKTPATISVKSIADLQGWQHGQSHPYVLKRDGSWAGNGVEIVSDEAMLTDCFARISARPSARQRLSTLLVYGDQIASIDSIVMKETAISAQEFIAGIPANAMFACQKGRILGNVQARVVAAVGRTRPGLIMELINDERIERAGQLLAEAFQFSGFFGLDFILSEATGEPYLIELNPRCTQLGHIQVANQPDLAGLLWAEWSGEAPPERGDPSLGNLFCSYPSALQLGLDDAYLRQARFDVSDEEMPLLDELANAIRKPTLIARMMQWLKHQRVLKLLKVKRILELMGVRRRNPGTQAPEKIIYFLHSHSAD